MHLQAEYPSFVVIDTLNVCNARCPFCPLFVGDSQMDRERRPATIMDHGLYERIMTEIAGWPQRPASIAQTGNGETLQDPKILDRLETIKRLELGPSVSLLTNAQFLTENIGEAILATQIFQLVIGFDGATKEVYEAHRVRCNYERVLGNIRRFAELRAERGASTRIHMKFVRTTKNQHEVEAAYELFREFLDPELDLFEDSLAIDWGDMPAGDVGYYYYNKVQDLPRKTTCEMDQSLTVQPDGKIAACCWDYNLDVSSGGLGDVSQGSLLDAYHSQERSRFRSALATGGEALPAKCASCIKLHDTGPVPDAERRLPASRLLAPTDTGFVYNFRDRLPA